jgi:hypothetical protein
VVTLYRRPGCSLCDQAEHVIASLALRMQFRVERIDIEADDAVLKRYMLEIPVVAFGGKDVAAWPFSAARLEEALRVAGVGGRGSGV